MTLDEEFEELDHLIPGFGGAWVDSATAVVVLVDTTQQEIAARIFASYSSSSGGELRFARSLPLRFVKGRYSFGQLQIWREAFDQTGLLPGVVYSDVDEVRNQVVVAVDNQVAGDRSSLHSKSPAYQRTRFS